VVFRHMADLVRINEEHAWLTTVTLVLLGPSRVSWYMLAICGS
jgi:hypothetical protein